jgi:hypothetical protein
VNEQISPVYKEYIFLVQEVGSYPVNVISLITQVMNEFDGKIEEHEMKGIIEWFKNNYSEYV